MQLREATGQLPCGSVVLVSSLCTGQKMGKAVTIPREDPKPLPKCDSLWLAQHVGAQANPGILSPSLLSLSLHLGQKKSRNSDFASQD